MYCELFCLCFYFLKENISKMDSKLEIHQRIDNFIKTRYLYDCCSYDNYIL